MILIIVAAILVLAIAFFQVVQGLYSSLIMAILTPLCAMVAFNFYESLAERLLYSRQPATADAIALVALFVLTLLVVRIVVDKLIVGNVIFSMWADRIGGGLLGIFTGMIMVGVLAVAAQMLPFGPTVLGYEPFDDTLQRKQSLAPFYPDEFTLGLVNMLSGGSLSAEREYSRAHDNLPLELYCARNMVVPSARVDAMPDSLKVVEAYHVPDADVAKWKTDGSEGAMSLVPGAGKVYVVRMLVDKDCREEGEAKAANWWLLPATHFRLVTSNGKSHYPVAYLFYQPDQPPEDSEGTSSKGPPPSRQGSPPRLIAAGGPRAGIAAGTPTRPAADAGPGQWCTREAQLRAGRPRIGQLILGRKWEKDEKALTVDWIYLIPDAQAAGLEVDRPKGKPSAYVVFRRVAKAGIPKVVEGLPDPKDALKGPVPEAPRRPAPKKPESRQGSPPRLIAAGGPRAGSTQLPARRDHAAVHAAVHGPVGAVARSR